MTLLDTPLPIILGIDASSTHLGWARVQGRQVLAHGTVMLRGDLTERICLAETALRALFGKQAPDAVAYEGAVKSFADAIIAQQQVVGVLKLTAARMGLLTVEIAPASAKKALTGSGRASKTEMQATAHEYGVCGEHAADAVGIGFAAGPLVKVVGR